jgi:NADH-quinone oxidoreductase subunit J
VTNLLAAATIPDAVTFAIAAAICVVGAFGVVLARNPVHSALMLVMTLFGVAVLFVEENAQFLAAVQVIVYAGAIVVLFLFVIMLLGVDRREAIERDPLPGQRLIAVCLGILGLVELLLLARGKWPQGPRSVSAPLGTPAANVSRLGRSVFTTYLLAFEITSALLVIAVVGAVVLARRPRRPAGDDGAPLGELIEPDDVIAGPDAGEGGTADEQATDAEDAEAADAEAAEAAEAADAGAGGRSGRSRP